MNTFRVFYLLGLILVFLAGTMALAALWSFQDGGAVGQAFLAAIVLTLLVGGIFSVGFRSYRRVPLSLTQSFTLVALTWFFAGVFGALPYVFHGVFPAFEDAFFEAVSGFTTTGATLITDIESQPRAILFWRSLTQWLGGMGIIVLFVAILPRFGFRNLTMFKAELPGPMSSERIVPRVAETARLLWLIYLALTSLQMVLLLCCGLSFFDAINHALTTMPTGGFSTYDSSVAGLDSAAAEWVIIVFMVLAGVNFALYYRMLLRDFGFLRNQELRFYLGGLVLLTAAVFCTIFPHTLANGWEAGRSAAFHIVSIVTTTGYATHDYDLWPPFAKALIFFLLFAGACGGSTSGGIKQVRLLLMVKYAWRELERLIHPNAVAAIRVGDRTAPEDILRGVLGFAVLYGLIFLLATLVLAALGLDVTTAASASAACLGNVGPGFAEVGPATTFAGVPALGKLVLSLLMILGRLEIYTVLVLVLPEARRLQRS